MAGAYEEVLGLLALLGSDGQHCYAFEFMTRIACICGHIWVDLARRESTGMGNQMELALHG